MIFLGWANSFSSPTSRTLKRFVPHSRLVGFGRSFLKGSVMIKVSKLNFQEFQIALLVRRRELLPGCRDFDLLTGTKTDPNGALGTLHLQSCLLRQVLAPSWHPPQSHLLRRYDWRPRGSNEGHRYYSNKDIQGHYFRWRPSLRRYERHIPSRAAKTGEVVGAPMEMPKRESQATPPQPGPTSLTHVPEAAGRAGPSVRPSRPRGLCRPRP